MAVTHFVAKSIVIESTGKFLLLTRSETHPHLAGLYDLPGGMIKAGEEPGAGVTREILEETGMRIEAPKVMYATTMMIGGESYPTLLYLVRVQGNEPTIDLSWEHSAYEWAEIERLNDVEPQLAPTYREALDYIETNGIINDID